MEKIIKYINFIYVLLAVLVSCIGLYYGIILNNELQGLNLIILGVVLLIVYETGTIKQVVVKNE